MSDRVSPDLGYGPLASPGVKMAPAPFAHSSIPILSSQFRGPFVYNETDEERKKREDEEKSSNFDKVRQKAEREEAARKKAEDERDALLKEKADREAADKKAAEEKLTADKKFEDLAKKKEAEAEAKAAEAAAEKARADKAEEELNKFREAQEKELASLLESIPEDKRPPLTDSMSVTDKLTHVKYVKTLLDSQTPADGVGKPPFKQDGKKGDRLKELQGFMKTRPLTEEENLEYIELSSEQGS